MLKFIVDRTSGIALYRFAYADEVTFGSDGMKTPLRASDIKENTHEVIIAQDPPFWAGHIWSWDGYVWSIANQANWQLAFDQEKQKRKEAITAKRWAVETGGITVSGAAIATDAITQAKLSGALQLVQADNTVLIDWKGSDGSWVQLNASAVTAIAVAVGFHVQASFTREKELHTAVDNAVDIDALNLIDIESGSVDGSGSWPS